MYTKIIKRSSSMAQIIGSYEGNVKWAIETLRKKRRKTENEKYILNLLWANYTENTMKWFTEIEPDSVPVTDLQTKEIMSEKDFIRLEEIRTEQFKKDLESKWNS